VIERFKDRGAIPVYGRVRDEGITFPEGLAAAGSSQTSTAVSS